MSIRRVRRKLLEWSRRYLPAEIVGTVAALAAAWLVLRCTGSLAAAATCGVVAENLGYYGVIGTREVRDRWRAHADYNPRRRAWLATGGTARGMLLEFGVAELLDSFVVRPGLFYMVPLLLPGHTMLAFLVAKLTADLVFYGCAIIAYETSRRVALRTEGGS